MEHIMYDYKKLVLNSLYDNGVIDELLYEKCSKPSYIQDLPYDLRTTDVDKLNERKSAVEEKIDEIEKNIGKLEKDKDSFSNFLESDGKFILKRVDDLDNYILNVFKDYFGDPNTDKPEKIIDDVRYGLEDNRTANAMERFMGDINNFKEEYDTFKDKMYTAIENKESPEVISNLMNSFNNKYSAFFDKYYKYDKEYGGSGYLDDDSASHSMQVISMILSKGQANRNFELLEGYTNSYNRLDRIENDLQIQNNMLADFNLELDLVNDKLE